MTKKKDKTAPEFDRRTKAYKQAAAERGVLVIDPSIEVFAEYIYDCGYRGTTDQSYWVPTSEIREVAYAKFPGAPYLTNQQVGKAILAAEPDAVRRLRRPYPGAKAVYGYAGITGPSCVRSK